MQTLTAPSTNTVKGESFKVWASGLYQHKSANYSDNNLFWMAMTYEVKEVSGNVTETSPFIFTPS